MGHPSSAGCGCGGGSWPRKHRAGQNKDLSCVNILRGGHEQEYEQDYRDKLNNAKLCRGLTKSLAKPEKCRWDQLWQLGVTAVQRWGLAGDLSCPNSGDCVMSRERERQVAVRMS